MGGMSDRQRALRDSEVIVSLHKQAEMVRKERTARMARLDLDSVNRLIEARQWISQILKIERRR